VAASVIVTGLVWLVLDQVFHIAWPVSILGEAYPALRERLPFI
jgi:hypothetical protein